MDARSVSPGGHAAFGELALILIEGCSLLAFIVCMGVLPRHRRPDAPHPPMCRYNPYNIGIYPELLTPTGRRYWRGMFISWFVALVTLLFGLWIYPSV